MPRVSKMKMVYCPFCGEHIINGHKMKPKELQECFEKHKKRCKLYIECKMEEQEQEDV